MKRIFIALLLTSIIFTSCTSNETDNTTNIAGKNNVQKVSEDNDINSEKDDNEEKDQTREDEESNDKGSNNPMKTDNKKKRNQISTYMGVERIINPITKTQNLSWWFNSRYGGKFPEYSPDHKWPVDLRSADLRKFNIRAKSNTLFNSIFDTETKWPLSLPKDFNPDDILNENKDPGLSVRDLHKRGITGEGVGLAIIDYATLSDHQEYKDNLKLYEHIHHSSNSAHFHGPSVSSIAVGKTCGVAPKADLYFIGCQNYDVSTNDEEKKLIHNGKYIAISIERILEVNKTLPPENRIRVISISSGYKPEDNGYEDFVNAVEKAREEGIFVVSSNLFQYNEKFHFWGLYREPLADPNSISAYTPYVWEDWISLISHIDNGFFEKGFDNCKEKEILLIPMDSKTTASASGDDGYVFWRKGGWSWGIPYISGLYVLGCQVDPCLTPERFWETAYETGTTKEVEKDGKKYKAKIVNPIKLMETIENNE